MNPAGLDEETAGGGVNNIPCPDGRDPVDHQHHDPRDRRAGQRSEVRDGGAEGCLSCRQVNPVKQPGLGRNKEFPGTYGDVLRFVHCSHTHGNEPIDLPEYESIYRPDFARTNMRR